MTRAEKIEKAKRLRADGLFYREIGEKLGVTSSCVQKWLKPEQAKIYNKRDWNPAGRERRRRAERKARVSCANCGKPCGVGSAWRPERKDHRPIGKRVCGACWHEEQGIERRARGEQIVKWWADGLTLAEIADRLDWSREHVGVEMHRLREDGYDLPYRRTPGSPRFPKQVAA